MNHASIKGNLTRDPETRFLPSGISITEFGIAINERYTNKDGEKMEKTIFLNCKAWGKLGDEVIAKFFSKGSPILVWGRLDVEEWEDRDSQQKRSKVVIVVEGFDFCGDKKAEQRDPGYNETRQQPRPAPSGQRAPAPVDRRQREAPPALQDDFDGNPLDDSELPF